MPLNVTPDTLVNGETAEISYGPDPSRANGTVTVEISDGTGKTDEVEIELDENGEGTKTWDVPGWTQAYFNAPGCDEVFRYIVNQPT